MNYQFNKLKKGIDKLKKGIDKELKLVYYNFCTVKVRMTRGRAVR